MYICYTSIMLRPLIAGFVIKIAAGFDDMFSRVPVVVALTRTRIGKVAFAVGNLLAVILVIATVRYVAPLMGGIENYRTFVGVVILAIAVVVYFELFSGFSTRRQEGVVKRFSARFSLERFLTLVAVGFIVSLVTLIDDAVVYMPLFVHDGTASWLASAGILAATFIQLIVLVYAAERLAKVRYQKEIAAAVLVIYAALVFIGVV